MLTLQQAYCRATAVENRRALSDALLQYVQGQGEPKTEEEAEVDRRNEWLKYVYVCVCHDGGIELVMIVEEGKGQ